MFVACVEPVRGFKWPTDTPIQTRPINTHPGVGALSLVELWRSPLLASCVCAPEIATLIFLAYTETS